MYCARMFPLLQSRKGQTLVVKILPEDRTLQGKLLALGLTIGTVIYVCDGTFGYGSRVILVKGSTVIMNEQTAAVVSCQEILDPCAHTGAIVKHSSAFPPHKAEACSYCGKSLFSSIAFGVSGANSFALKRHNFHLAVLPSITRFFVRLVMFFISVISNKDTK